ncbi:hypothetical protein Tco_1318776 [Tanacetum coccineum]
MDLYQTSQQRRCALLKPTQISPQTNFLTLNARSSKGYDYDTWAMEMEHYLEYIDNEVWKVIQNGNSKKRVTKGDFNGMDDAKEIWAALYQKELVVMQTLRNAKKKAVLKQQFEAFTISSKESLEKGYDRFQKLLSQLDALGAGVSDEDANHKFL